MEKLIEKLYVTHSLDNEELLYLIRNIKGKFLKLLFNYAYKTKLEYYGEKIYIRGIVEFSSYCKNTCLYCGLRSSNKKAQRYRLTTDQILDCCKEGRKAGYRTFVLQSGEDSFYTADLLADIVTRVKNNCPDCAVTLSIGEKSYSTYKKLFQAGADRYLLRHETASKNLYQKLHPKMSFENRKRCLNDLRDIGYQIGAGFIVGLPGQTDEVLTKDLLFLKKLKPHMVGTGPLIIHPNTPLKNDKNGTVMQTLKCLALIRLLLPNVLLPATTALRVIDPNGWIKGLKAGANVIMLNLSPESYRKKYDLYQGKDEVLDKGKQHLQEVLKSVEQIGCKVDMSRGDHILWKRKKEEKK